VRRAIGSLGRKKHGLYEEGKPKMPRKRSRRRRPITPSSWHKFFLCREGKQSERGGGGLGDGSPKIINNRKKKTIKGGEVYVGVRPLRQD